MAEQAPATLSRFDVAREDLSALGRSIAQLDRLFLLVIIGEFNAGKSAFINALLGTRLLEEGVTPTTAQIHLVRYGERASTETLSSGVRVVTAPLDILRDIHIVDTPGTNAIIREHEQLTTDFVPRSDFVLFVTPQGHLVTAQAISFFAPDSDLHGVLARQRELGELEHRIGGAREAANAARTALSAVESELDEAQQRYHAESMAFSSQQRRCHDLELELLQLRQAAEAAENAPQASPIHARRVRSGDVSSGSRPTAGFAAAALQVACTVFQNAAAVRSACAKAGCAAKPTVATMAQTMARMIPPWQIPAR